MGDQTIWNGEAIIADALGRAPDVQLGADGDGWRLSRWRQFVGSYTLPPLPDPIFVVHIAGKPTVRTWERDGWSETSSFPGCATIVPSGQSTGWLVDGELDVVTLSLSSANLRQVSASDRFKRMRFAFSDPLGVALTRQVLGELYAPATPERDVYVGALVGALTAHMLRGPMSGVGDIPTAAFSAHRLHHVMNAILRHPENDHSLEEMAANAGVTPSHFCRIFKKANGVSPHQYVMKARLERAQHLLSQTDTSMSAIADLLGFTSQSHFTRAFRQFTGRTPSDFRRQDKAQ
ncbi:MAG TPA: AraC family transcriptional regulator [Caulobacteraceae bacterium]